MGIFLPPLSVILFIYLLWTIDFKYEREVRNISFRRLILVSFIIHALLVFSFNEIVSVFDGISTFTVNLFWGGLVAVELILAGLSFKSKAVRDAWYEDLSGIVSSDAFLQNKILLLAVAVFYLLPLFLLTLAVPPNNFDAHSYHLTRIIEWIGNGNVEHFPTRHIQQLYHNIMGEYLVTHTFLLSGSEQFAGFVQFFACAGSICGVSLIAKKLGAPANAQILASIILITLPIGILESTSVQVDYVACFFFIAFIYFGYEALDSLRRDSLILMALALAFGGFSKYTIFMYALPFSIYFGCRFVKIRGIYFAARVVVLFIFVIAIVFSPFLSRNYRFFGNVLSPADGQGLETEKLSAGAFSVPAALSGTAKNAMLHVGLPSISYNSVIETAVAKVHQWTNVTLNPAGMDQFVVRFVIHEDMVPNNVHLVLIGVSLLSLFFIRANWRLKWFSICLTAGFVVFSSMMVFQLWSTRTHMPFFAMGGILAAIVFERLLKNRSVFLSVFLLIASVVFVIGNPSKPIVPLTYFFKKILNYAPIAICPVNEAQARFVSNKLGRFYASEPNNANCFVLIKDLNPGEKKHIFESLDSLGYYDAEKYQTVFDLNDEEMAFLSHPSNYEKFKDLLSPFSHVNGNVGVLFKGSNGFYQYWAVTQKDSIPFRRMQYIGYRPKYAVLENAQRAFSYDYILGDDPELLAPFYRKEAIDTVYRSKGFYLAKLSRPMSVKIMITD